jgi:membrane protein implicated in regulation of membrane protease activity
MFGVLTRAKAVKKRTLSLARLNVELAKLEGKQKATAIGTGAGLGAGAGVLLVYAIGFAFAALAAGLSEAISLWLSLLIVAGILFLAAAIAAYLAVRFFRKAAPATPAQALEEAARTLETFEGRV